ncbi:MAG: acetyltransferase component of pyruvate dehydrogenase complex [Candidatus Sericytochromatia bacterium]|nr:MAG: acetyltransferase component of pyruvate dehydrogenase complex [Candidatus Sericytochromatia bacterium]
MEKEIKLPVLGDNISSSEVVKILVKEGDSVVEGQALAEFSSDKATIELPSEFQGIIKKVFIKEGDSVKINDKLFLIEVKNNSNNNILSKTENDNNKFTSQDKVIIENNIKEKDIKENIQKEIRLPILGDNISSSEVVKILVKEGDSVVEGQALAEFSSDKATIELPSEFQGTIKKIFIKEGDSVKVNDLLFTIELKNGNNQDIQKNSLLDEKNINNKEYQEENFSIIAREGEKNNLQKIEREQLEINSDFKLSNNIIPASPSVRRFAREIGIDILKVKGSGKNGRITIDDVKKFSKSLNENRISLNLSNNQEKYFEVLPDFSKWGNIEKEKMNNIRHKTAQHLSFAWNTIPHVTQFIKVDITELEKLRKKHSQTIEKSGAKLTITSILVKFITYALKKFPKFNCSIDLENKEIIYKSYYNIGVAVDTPKGLLVPVIRNADQKNLMDISLELKTISEKARDFKLSLEDMQGATFTITNLGGIEGDYFTPIINYPEVAILGVSKSKIEPVYIDNKFEARLILPLSLSYDHRIIDGADAARFLKYLKEILEDNFFIFI